MSLFPLKKNKNKKTEKRESYRICFGTWDKIIESMRKEELIKQLQECAPLLANVVSHMVEYIQDRCPAAYPSKEQTEAVNDYLHSVHADGDGSMSEKNCAVSPHRISPLPLSAYWTADNLTGCKTCLTISHTIGSIICRREVAECTVDFLFWLHHL